MTENLQQLESECSTSSQRPRCQHVSRRGRPCRNLAISVQQPFCKDHVPPPPPGTPEELAFSLRRAAGGFASPLHVKNVMADVFCAMLDRRLSPKEAGVLCYIAQTILHAQRLSAYLDKLDAERANDEDDGIPRNYYGEPIVSYQPPIPTTDDDSSIKPPAAAPACSGGSLACPDEGRDPCSSPSATASDDASSTSAASHDDSPSASTPADANASKKGAGTSSSTSSTSSTSVPPKIDLNHFYPRDATLPHHLQDPNTAWIPPSQAEIDRRNARFDRVHGFRRHNQQRRVAPGKSDWDIINGR